MEQARDRERIAAAATRFIGEKLEPVASAMDEREEFHLENFRELGRLGLLGIPYPAEYGGAGLDYTAYSDVISGIAEEQELLVLFRATCRSFRGALGR